MFLTQTLHRQVQQCPDATYSIFGSRTLTNAEVMDRVSRLAGGLHGLGVAKDDRVAILALNSDRYFQFLLGVAWADAVMVPVNIRWSVAEIAYSLVDAGVTVLFIDDAFARMLPALQAECPELTTVVYCGEAETPEGMIGMDDLIAASQPMPDAHRGGEELAGIFYTGGTTGFPKGVMLSHRNLLVSALGCIASGAGTFGGQVLYAAPLFHLAAMWQWCSSSLVGSTHIVVSMFEPVSVMATIVKHQVNTTLLVPTMIQMLVDHPDLASYDLSCLGQLFYGASPISPALLERSRRMLPGTRFVQGYGMTETGPIVSMLSDADHDDPALRRSAGRGAPHASVKIVDPQGDEVPRGTVGEIIVGGEHVMKGYWNKPVETAEALRGGWMHTGDGGFMDERGYVFIADRIKDMIITGGENVYSTEVEAAVATHPAVAQVAVIGLPDADWGERVHAVVSVVDGAELTIDDLRAHCREQIAGYKCPRSLDIVTEFPISGAGKVLKRELRARYL
ncbi:MAG TPA: long-chain fatty acid--CoA ligase [Jatrophihabitantaceae bacterium]|jgi:acyl-CoA synthetase (AMP-forming)/AMP-acid ligase II